MLNCLRCGKGWEPRDKTKMPKTCPRCCSPYWDKPRKNSVPEIVAGDPARVEVVEPSRHMCRLKDCGHVWTSRIVGLPLVCPKCHSKNWNAGITPADARAYLNRMSNAVCGTVADFAKIIGMDTVSLVAHMKGEPMTLSMLQSVEGILKAKGYKFLGMEEHASRSAELEAIELESKGQKPPLSVWEKFLGDRLQNIKEGE